MFLFKNIDLKRALFLLTVSQGVLSKAVKRDCSEDFGDAVDDINDIATNLNITPCEAADVYNYIVKGENYFKQALDFEVDSNFSEENCVNKCNEANQRLNGEFENIDQTRILEYSQELLGYDYLSSCTSNCHLRSLDAQVMEAAGDIPDTESSQSEQENLMKRDSKECVDANKGKIKLTSSKPYKNGIYRYTQEPDSAQTAIAYINGCGPKNSEAISKIVGKLKYADEFLPACNSHDICYSCHRIGRKDCDNAFKDNMRSICSTIYSASSGDNFIKKAKKAIQKVDCITYAELFADAVSLFGTKSYNQTPVDTSIKCASCGVDIIKDKLYKTPFYVLK